MRSSSRVASFRIVGVVPDVLGDPAHDVVGRLVPDGNQDRSGYRDQLRGGHLGVGQAQSPEDKAAAQAELRTHLAAMQLPDGYTEAQSGLDTPLEALSREMFGSEHDRRAPELVIALFLALALLFMVLPAVNLANLAISRTLERAAEIGVRKAFGASGRQLIGQLLFENLILTLIGGAISVPLTGLVLAILNRIGLDRAYADFGINGRVLLWGLLAAVVFSVLSGLYPAWRLSRLTPAEAMRGRLS